MNPLEFIADTMKNEETSKLLDRIMRARINVKVTTDELMLLHTGLMGLMAIKEGTFDPADFEMSVALYKDKELKVLSNRLMQSITSAFEEFGVDMDFNSKPTEEELMVFVEFVGDEFDD